MSKSIGYVDGSVIFARMYGNAFACEEVIGEPREIPSSQVPSEYGSRKAPCGEDRRQSYRNDTRRYAAKQRSFRR
jgi:hypothetical protein